MSIEPDVLTDEDLLFEEPVWVSLPGSRKKNKKVLLRRPRPGYYVRNLQPVPQSVAVQVQGAESTQPDRDELAARAKFWVKLLTDTFVRPRLVAGAPGKGEICPLDLFDEDFIFIRKWVAGEIAADGSDLAAFRPAESAAGDADSRSVQDLSGDAPEPVPARNGR
jgi:hypothetical protein